MTAASDEGLILALAVGATAAEAARRSGKSERTVRRRLADETFRRRVEEARTELLRSTIGRLAGLGMLAVETLHRNLTCGKPAVETRAATAALTFLYRGAELDTLAQQIAELQRQVEGLQRGKHARVIG
jgi:hypothetical protein